ncbi:BTAD domain-containing putative transcriptional regulator [Streptomyces sp. NPDC058122]|uniref:AfsR/SARP family transcriptional regulator n=1 Tax=Streptomyces sp. NPDC058122 TaxID=3346349 RepID=UPI0036DFE31D
MRNGLRFGLLGPPVLYDTDGEVVPIGGRKMRALLAALLLEPGRVVSVAALKDALWGGAPPASAQASLQNHATRLRRLLDDPERLRAVPPGYVLRVGEGELDVRVFERHATAARDAHAERDWERALRESTAALALWRGIPLSGLPPETGGHAFVQRLEEGRLLVLEWGYEAELRLDPTASRLDRLAPELAARTVEHPLRESFHRLLMLVLHRTGRQAEALAVHRDLRARLLDDLGIEPGPAVRRAHLEILRDNDRVPGEAHATDVHPGGGRAGDRAMRGNGSRPDGTGSDEEGSAWIPGVGTDRRRGGDRRQDRRAQDDSDRAGSGDADGDRARSGEGNGGRGGAWSGDDDRAGADDGTGSVGGDGERGRYRDVDQIGSAWRDGSAGRNDGAGGAGGVGRDGDGGGGRYGGAGREGGVGGRYRGVGRDGDDGRDGTVGRAANPGRDRAADREGGAGGAGGAGGVGGDGGGGRYGGAGRDGDVGGAGGAGRDGDGGRYRGAGRDGGGGRGSDASRGRGGDDGRDGGRGRDGNVGPDGGVGRDGDDGGVEPGDGSAQGGRGVASPPRPAQLPPSPAHFTGREDVRDRLFQVLDPEIILWRTHPEGPAHVTGGPDDGASAPAFADASARASGGKPAATTTAGAPGRTTGQATDDQATDGRATDGRATVGRATDGEASAGGSGDGARGDAHGRHFGGDPTTVLPRVAVISGMAGVGKSALALHVAHGLRERFTDGQLYVNLHGATPGMTPLTAGQALAALLRDLGAEPRRIPEHPDAAAALLRSMLAPTRTLMVLDDAAHAAQVRPLLPAGAGCAVIVTSRSPLTALDGADRFPLAPLTHEDSAALLRAVSGRQDGLDGDHPLVELTGRLPLALRVVAARLAARRALTPDVLAGQLAATEGRLHHLEYDDLSVRRSLAVAHDALRASEREADRDAALALCRIGALDLPAYGAALVARLTGTDERRAEAALDRLVDVALLEETAYGRYAPHDLVRDFAREIAGEAECVLATTPMAADADADAATGVGLAATGPVPLGHDAAVAERALRWYAGVAARSLEAILEPGLDREDRSRPTASQPAGHAADVAATPPFCSGREAFAWGDTELANVVALAQRHTHASPYFPLLARLLNPYVQRSGRVAELEVLQRAALDAARLLGDEAAEAYALGDLGGLHFVTGRVGEALTLNDEALAIWSRLGVRSCQRRALNNRGMLLESLGRHAESSEALLQSLEFSRELGDPHMEAITYSHLGNLYEHTDPRAAIDHHKRSLAIGDAVQDVIIRHSAHCNIGYAHLTLGEPAAAVPHFEESLRILGGHGDWHGESQTRLGLVRALRGVGHRERAARECDLLRCRADRRADRYTGGLARHQAGLLLRECGDAEAAYAEWTSALEALAETDSPVTGELRNLLADGADGADRAGSAVGAGGPGGLPASR